MDTSPQENCEQLLDLSKMVYISHPWNHGIEIFWSSNSKHSQQRSGFMGATSVKTLKRT